MVRAPATNLADAMNEPELAATVDAAWEARETITPTTTGAWREAVEALSLIHI